MDKRRSLSDEEILAQIPAAKAHAAKARKTGMRATAASYDPARHMVMLELTNGYAFGFPVDSVRALRRASAQQLARVRVTPSGASLHWDALDADLDVAGLIVASLGKAALSEFGRAAGSVTSDRKAAAARANGAKGGRPRGRARKAKVSTPKRRG